MQSLKKSKLLNISSWAYSVLGPNFNAYRKLILWILNLGFSYLLLSIVIH